MNKPEKVRPQHPVEHAKRRMDMVQEELEVAAAELNLSHAMLDRNLPAQHRQGEVKKALDQTAIVERKISDAAEELEEVTGLLADEVAQRRQLEAQLAARAP